MKTSVGCIFLEDFNIFNLKKTAAGCIWVGFLTFKHEITGRLPDNR